MHRQRRTSTQTMQRRTNRTGSAPVEFVMALPVLLSMFVLILTVGAVSMARLESTVKARGESWSQRFDKKSQRPLAYTEGSSKNDVFDHETSITPKYPSPKMTFGSASSRHAFLGGAWDHRELLKGNGPHWNDMAKASVGGATNQISSLLDQFSDGFDPSAIPGIGEIAGGLIGSLLGQQDSVNNQFEQEGKKQEEENRKNIEKLEQKNQELAAEKMALQKQLDDQLYPMKKEIVDRMEKRKEQITDETDAEKKKELLKQQDDDQKALDNLNLQIMQKENRIEAITQEMNANQGLIDRLKTL